MREDKIDKENFLELPTKEILKITGEKAKPKTGIFVPDGSRRLTMALSQKTPGSEDFYPEYVRLTTSYFKKNLSVFFAHGLNTLFVPAISANLFKRSKKYRQSALYKILEIIFNNKDWLDFYNKTGIRVKVYGNLKYFTEKDYPGVLQWIKDIAQITAKNRSHTLFYGFAAANETSTEFTDRAIDFYKIHGRKPTEAEQLESLYGENLQPADFFIMSTKFAGLGALPPLMVNRETRMYFLAAPGLLALTRETYRKILYDLLFCPSGESNREYTKNDLKNIESLKTYYLDNQSAVFGLSEQIGSFRVLTGQPLKHGEKR